MIHYLFIFLDNLTQWSLSLFETITIILTAFTIWFVIKEHRATIVHNKLSVKPKLRLDFSRNPRQAYYMHLINCGVGPAIINKITMFVDGKIFHAKKPIDDFGEAISSLTVFGTNLVVLTLPPGDTLMQGEKQVLVSESEHNPLSVESRIVFIKNVDRIKIVVNFSSIYNESDSYIFDFSTV
ncbi:MAG: hypothetical protein ACYC09_14805 [Bacteroidota bacterium]